MTQRPYHWKPSTEFSHDARQLLFSFAEPNDSAGLAGRLSTVGGQFCPQTKSEVSQTSAQVGEIRSATAPLERAHN